MALDEKALQEWLDSGNERPALAAMMAQRVMWTLGLLLFLAWLFWARLQPGPLDTGTFAAAMVAVLAAVVLRLVVRRLDRIAMRKDMALFERAMKSDPAYERATTEERP